MTSTHLNLYDGKINRLMQIVAMPDISLLKSLGLRLGTSIKIQNRYSLGGPLLLRVEDSFSVAVGKDVAKQISVSEITE